MLLGSTARLLLLAAAMLFFSGAVNAEPDAPLAAALQTGSPSGASVDAAAMQSLRQFYEDRGNRYAWTSPDNGGEPNAAGRAVIAFLQTVSRDGLNPKAYTIPDTLRGTDAEMAIATALLRYSIDVRSGRVEPEKDDPELFRTRVAVDQTGILRNAATGSEIEAFLETLAPRAVEYRALREALVAYRGMAESGGWQPVPGIVTIKPGHAGPELQPIWERLRITGDIDRILPMPATYDDALVAGVMRFQRRHGLSPDGNIGPRTRAALNAPVSQRIRQIELNMERWRWLPDDLGETHVIVNLAGFDLRAVRRGEEVRKISVIVGRPYRRSPVFSDRISYLELNPDWTVPYKIATQDILPKLQADPGYLAENNFQVLPAGGGVPVDPASIDWTTYGRRNFPFLLRQLPGPTNALGRIKFMFPNRFSVYLHDTPARELFRQDVRMFSSGCIRVAEPMALAAFLLEGDPAWTPEALQNVVDTGKTKVIRLRQTVPVHLTYQTAWVAADGTVQFREDVYNRDTLLAAALFPAGNGHR